MRSLIIKKTLLVIFILSLLLTGCQPKTAPQKPGDFFPMTKNSFWEYEGQGNEFASFTREVVFVENSRAQLREDNGGTIMATVIEATDSAIIRTFSRGEAYGNENYLDQQSNESTILIQSPIETGTKWEIEESTREIIDTKALVKTPVGEFTDCLTIVTKVGDSTITEYYKVGIGLVKKEFKSGDVSVTSTLKKYNIQ